MLDLFKKSFAAGIMISISTILFLLIENKIIGAIFFSIGLFYICSYKMNLYTGKIGYILQTKKIKEYFLIWCGNLLGTFCSASIFKIINPNIEKLAMNLISIKTQQNFINVFLSACFCGILMYLAVNNFNKKNYGIISIFLSVTVFILCGFEHSIADMGYIFLTSSFNLNLFFFILIVSFGNAIGAILINQLTTYKKEEV